ncbi:MAG: hypothetical protein HKP34_03100 [Nitrosopumilus sp.]|nr:hypothetical protein [Nitrosopumilus sp.]NNL37275.1 hypothetical protein [Nitrosopumilus sp.]
MKTKIIFALIPLFVIVTIFSFTIQDSFGESRHECRVQQMNDKSLTPVERVYALKTCEPEEKSSSFQKYYSEELHNECTRTLKENSQLNHITRLNDLKECNKLQKPDSSSQKLTKFYKTTIEICDEKYQIYLLVGAKNMKNQAGGLAEKCVQLYLAPMWNSTSSDRMIQLQNFVSDKIEQKVEEGKELRQKDVEEAQLENTVFFHLKYLFEEQKEKIRHLESKLKEKNISLDYSKQDFFNQNYKDCLKIVYDKTVIGREKIHALDDCSKIETEESIMFIHNEILEKSKDLVQVCNRSYDSFLKLSIEDYYASMKNQRAGECVILYKNPIWEYNQEDRIEVIEKFVYEKSLKHYEKYVDRKNSVNEAHLNAYLVPILSDLYKYQNQKIALLEDLLKDE